MKAKKRSSLHIIFVASAVVLFWRGTWGLLDLYFFPDHPLSSYLFSFVLGIIILLLTKKLSDQLN